MPRTNSNDFEPVSVPAEAKEKKQNPSIPGKREKGQQIVSVSLNALASSIISLHTIVEVFFIFSSSSFFLFFSSSPSNSVILKLVTILLGLVQFLPFSLNNI